MLLSKKLCILPWDEKFHLWPLFHIHAISSQLFKKPVLYILGVGFNLCQTINWNVSNNGSNVLCHSPNLLYPVNTNIFPLGFIILTNSVAKSLGLISTLSQSLISLFIAFLPGIFIFPVEYLLMLYGGSVSIKSIELSLILFTNSK